VLMDVGFVFGHYLTRNDLTSLLPRCQHLLLLRLLPLSILLRRIDAT